MTQPSRRTRYLSLVALAGFVVLTLGTTAWAAAALSVHFAGALLIAFEAALIAAALTTLALRFRSRRAGLAGLALIAVIIGGWYMTIQPSNDRDWAADVARGVTAEIAGDQVTLHNVRAFDWQDRDRAEEHWVTRHYELTKLDSIDMFTSVWDNPDIAHLLVSFGFSDGQHVVFSVEIRREAGEEFEILGGFFRKFELVLIAAEENDIVKLRTNHRKEDVRLYPVRLDQARMREMFLTYTSFGNALAESPEFYNTITDNCTTTVYQLAKLVAPEMPLDIRLVKSGLLPEYLDEIGGLRDEIAMSERRSRGAITARAQEVPTGADFSDWIRAGQ
ncbi:DUF4105 domain-containing protein [Defluviimonas aestuarii]|uniref:Lnb N-terminal periplasmic domain-containing protein n=1 Tax=Albidovulum aestuarii TaxID=1130726 RepID=UPI00249BA612|nr:DUF4105 domain-containing protein [Defluviimonas aestuarii]MDI3336913.1 DUF4105 domain-containing protein [Defluviimonas aestuarii]